MKLTHMTVSDFSAALGSDSPAPGGGSASALCGAQGAGLIAMVAALTLGRKKYADHEALALEVKEQATRLRQKLEEQIDLDTDAYNMVADAFKLPKETDEQKKERSKAIADATLVATKVPFSTMEMALEALTLGQKLVSKSNTNAASDLGVAALNLNACIKGAWLNVKINLPGVKDADLAARFEKEGGDMVKAADALGAEIFEAVAQSL